MKKGLLALLIVLLLVAFGASALYLGNYFLEGKRQEDRYHELSSQVDSARHEAAAATDAQTEPATETTASPYGVPGESGNEDEYYTPDVIDEPENVPERPALVGGNDFLPWYMDLHAQNSDMVGWIEIEGTKVNYPVMQSSPEGANFYLYSNFDKEYSVRGSIYAYEGCDVFAPSDNITLFGHNMKDGSMFAYLGNYYDKATWEQNSLIFFDTLTESHVYKIFAVFKTTGNDNEGFAYHLMTDAENEAQFNQFVSECKRLSFYDTGITPVYGDKMICLSTCEYTLDNGRFVVAAVRIT